MKAQELLDKLIEAITADEWNRLKHGDSSLVISSFNREVLLSISSTSAENFEIDTKSIRNLHEALQQYLDIYMADRPIGHKWIIIASIFLTFVQRHPMHPQQATDWKRIVISEKTEYVCPCKDAGANSVCSYCVCRGVTSS